MGAAFKNMMHAILLTASNAAIWHDNNANIKFQVLPARAALKLYPQIGLNATICCTGIKYLLMGEEQPNEQIIMFSKSP